MSEQTERALTPMTNEHFVAFLRRMMGQPYWYGTCAYKCRKSTLSSKARQYPSHYTEKRMPKYQKHIEQKLVCADCIGVAKGYAWTNGGEGILESIGTDAGISNRYGSNGCPDKGTNGMLAYAKSKGMAWGAIGTLPEIPGLAVTTAGHVGYYAGNGMVYEFKGFDQGSVETELKNGKWTHWYQLPFLNYGGADMTKPAPEVPADYSLGARLLKKGSDGVDVMELQRILVNLGYDLGSYGLGKDGVDGAFGSATEKAVRKFQACQGIQVDGKYGTVTHAALMGVLADQSASEPGNEDDENETLPGKHVILTDNAVNIRTGPSTAYKIITQGNAGDTFPYVATAESSGWFAVEVNGKIGWICGRYADIVA